MEVTGKRHRDDSWEKDYRTDDQNHSKRADHAWESQSVRQQYKESCLAATQGEDWSARMRRLITESNEARPEGKPVHPDTVPK